MGTRQTVRLGPRERALLKGKNFAHLATMQPDDTPHVSVVWIDVDDDGTILVNTVEGRVKERNMRRDGRVGLSVSDSDDPYTNLSVSGHVVDITRDGADAHIDALAKRYKGQDRYDGHRPDKTRVIVKIRPEQVRTYQL